MKLSFFFFHWTADIFWSTTNGNLATTAGQDIIIHVFTSVPAQTHPLLRLTRKRFDLLLGSPGQGVD